MTPVRSENIINYFLFGLFVLIPKNLLSFATGWLARLDLPRPLKGILAKMFVGVFGINMDEAEKPLKDYATIEDIFTRALRPGQRPIEADFCSPADGKLCQSGITSKSAPAVQAKGLTYSLEELVFGAQTSKDLSWFATIYLAPHNYHRVHAPVSGKLMNITYFGGELWPVNPPFVSVVPDLFVRNERLVFEIQMEQGICYVVMVGALNVGRMVSPHWPHMTTNAHGRVLNRHRESRDFEAPLAIKAGDELGTFMLGSTVIVVFDTMAREQLKLSQLPNGPVTMGQSFLN